MAASAPSDPADLDESATDLLLAYEAMGITALVITLTDDALYVRCQAASDVVPICKKVLSEHEVPGGDRTLN